MIITVIIVIVDSVSIDLSLMLFTADAIQ